MIEALSALAPIAQASLDTEAANDWAPLLTGVVPGIVGAAIGYLFGTMRDWNRNKADRRAKHQDEVLAAATEILASVSKLAVN